MHQEQDPPALSEIVFNRARELREEATKINCPDTLDAALRLEKLGLVWMEAGTTQ